MVIECPVCRARFRFDKSLFKAASGASVRCRRCRGSIEIRNPDFFTHQAAPGPPRDSRQDATEPRGRGTPIAPDAASREGPEVFFPSLPVFLRQDTKELAENFGIAGPAGERSRRRGKGSLIGYLGAALACLLGLVSVLWYFRSPDGERTLASSPALGRAASAEASASDGRYEFDRVETFYQVNQQEGRLFVLKGRVSHKPPYTGQGRILVRVSVRSATKGVIAEKTVLAGAVIRNDLLLRGRRGEIEQAMSAAPGARDAETEPTSGEPLPFAAVFFDDIGLINSYELAAENERREPRADQGPDARALNPAQRW